MTAAFDAILSLGLVACAAAALVLRDRRAAVAAFMIAGLLVALSWVRLEAPDVALAEAAIGAGLTGALLLRGARRMGPLREPPARAARGLAAAVLAAAFAAGIGWVFATAPGQTVHPPLVAERLAETGVSNPVTAVLLAFRAWDTLLEIAVLVVALPVVRLAPPARLVPERLGELVAPFAALVVPLGVLLAGHLLWRGATAPGGAFQAGAVLAGTLLVLRLGGFAPDNRRVEAISAGLGFAGLALFLGAALAVQAATGHLLGWPAGSAKLWILAVESGLTLAIAAILCLLFTGTGRSTP